MIRRLIALSLLATLAACGSVGQILEGMDRPSASVADARVIDVGLDSAPLEFDVDVANPYSFPIPETGNARVDLAEHMVDKIYFAGEATNTNGHHATVHGAMETGARAVREILQSVSSE